MYDPSIQQDILLQRLLGYNWLHIGCPHSSLAILPGNLFIQICSILSHLSTTKNFWLFYETQNPLVIGWFRRSASADTTWYNRVHSLPTSHTASVGYYGCSNPTIPKKIFPPHFSPSLAKSHIDGVTELVVLLSSTLLSARPSSPLGWRKLLMSGWDSRNKAVGMVSQPPLSSSTTMVVSGGGGFGGVCSPPVCSLLLLPCSSRTSWLPFRIFCSPVGLVTGSSPQSSPKSVLSPF